MTQAVYIGAGFDADAVFALPHIQRFVYSDGLPLTDYSTASYLDGSWFIPRLKNEFMEKGFILKKETSCKLVFVNSAGQVIDYYHSQPFPRISKELEQEIRESDYMILCGFDPHKKILSMIKSDCCIIAATYGYDEEDDPEHVSTIGELKRSTDKYPNPIVFNKWS